MSQIDEGELRELYSMLVDAYRQVTRPAWEPGESDDEFAGRIRDLLANHGLEHLLEED